MSKYKNKKKQKLKSEIQKNEEQNYKIYKKIHEKKQLREWIRLLKLGQKCLKCSENDSIVLEFHHRNPQTKITGIGEMVSRGYSRKAIEEEIKKCDILCANCHKKAEQRIREKNIIK